MATEITPGSEQTLEAHARWRDHDAPVDEKFTPDFVDHDAAEGQPAGGEGPGWFWARFEKSFSDVERTIVETIATPRHVTTVMELSGTHTGEFRGHAPTGKRFTVRNVQVIAMRDGRAEARWGSTDELGILEQLGLI
jgi:predicted ester cyclase